MSRIIIGTSGKRKIGFDLDVLLPSRLLITADSGGGKSWVMRVLQEQLFGKVQVITIDPEGEFASLREKFPFVLVGKGGETPADTRSAGLVAERLLKLRASAICDIYDMKPHQRHSWVKLFIEGLIEAPKELRNPLVLIVDEAHVFGPEKGESEALGSMIDVATRGRKRGICLVCATQRLAMLAKDITSNPTERCSREYIGSFQPPTNTEEVVSLWQSRLSPSAFAMLKVLTERGGESIHRTQLAESLGRPDGGGFGNTISELRTAGLLVDRERGVVAANAETLLLPDHAA